MKARIIGTLAGSIPFSAVWLTAVHLPHGNPSPFLQAAGLLPQVVAITSLLIQNAADAYQPEQPAEQPGPALIQPRPRPKELTYR